MNAERFELSYRLGGSARRTASAKLKAGRQTPPSSRRPSTSSKRRWRPTTRAPSGGKAAA